MKRLYEMYIPITDNDGVDFPRDYLLNWESSVVQVSGGVTIFASATGVWINPETNEKVTEDVFPVRLSCEPEHMEIIANFTKGYFHQDTVMYYEVSDKVFMV